MVFEKLKQGKGISAELMDAFLRGFAETMFRNAAMPEDFRRLAALAVSEPGSGRGGYTVSPEQAKDMIYTLYCLMILRSEADQARRREDELKKENSRLRQILTIIGRAGRIRHKELAEELGISPSALTQHLGKYEYDGLFTAYKPGREKIYLLTDKGQTLLAGLGESTGMAADVSSVFPEKTSASSAAEAASGKTSSAEAAGDEKEVQQIRKELKSLQKELQDAKKAAADLQRDNRALKKKLTRTRKKQNAYQRQKFDPYSRNWKDRFPIDVENAEVSAEITEKVMAAAASTENAGSGAADAEKARAAAVNAEKERGPADELQNHEDQFISANEERLQKAVPVTENVYREIISGRFWEITKKGKRILGNAANSTDPELIAADF